MVDEIQAGEQKPATMAEMRARETWEIGSNLGTLTFKPMEPGKALQTYAEHFSLTQENLQEMAEAGLIVLRDVKAGKTYGRSFVQSLVAGSGADHHETEAQNDIGGVASDLGGGAGEGLPVVSGSVGESVEASQAPAVSGSSAQSGDQASN